MLRKASLLERLERPGTLEARMRKPSEAEVREGIRANLSQLLNAKRGFSPAQPGYGLGELNRWGDTASEQCVGLKREIARTITCFEPRLTSVRVEMLPPEESSVLLRFQVSAQLKSPTGEMRPVTFETSIDASLETKVS